MKELVLVRCSISEAIEASDLSALGRYLHKTKAAEPRFLRKIADMLDPRASGAPFLQLKNRPGRPPRRSFRPLAIISDPVALAMHESDLTFIAGHLRDPSNVDPRIIEWLAARLNPSTRNEPRFIVKRTRRPKGRPLSHQKKLELGRIGGRKISATGRLRWQASFKQDASLVFQAYRLSLGLSFNCSQSMEILS